MSPRSFWKRLSAQLQMQVIQELTPIIKEALDAYIRTSAPDGDRSSSWVNRSVCAAA
jgi:hypothetical protein